MLVVSVSKKEYVVPNPVRFERIMGQPSTEWIIEKKDKKTDTWHHTGLSFGSEGMAEMIIESYAVMDIKKTKEIENLNLYRAREVVKFR